MKTVWLGEWGFRGIRRLLERWDEGSWLVRSRVSRTRAARAKPAQKRSRDEGLLSRRLTEEGRSSIRDHGDGRPLAAVVLPWGEETGDRR